MHEFWIIGGEYASTAFDRLAEGAAEERHGPYDSLEEALRQWRRLSFRRIDECQVRYHIVETGGVLAMTVEADHRAPRVANG